MSDPQENVRALLESLGWTDDPEMGETPRQVAAFLQGFDPGAPLPDLSVLATESVDPLVARDLPFHSLCAHHLLPFFGTISIAIVPQGGIVGLGSLARVVQAAARRPQLQERLAAQVADHLEGALAPRSLAIRLDARQLCVEMRGACSSGTYTTWVSRGGPGARDLLA